MVPVFMKIKSIFLLVVFLLTPFISVAAGNIGKTDTLHFICSELLGRPTATSITINTCTDKAIDLYYEYGLDSLSYNNQTNVKTTVDSIPVVFTIENLLANKKYFYRMKYREVGMSAFIPRNSHSFHTARPKGNTFTFAIEADPHLDTNSNPAVYAVTLQNIASKNPDFLLDLGDTFMSEKLPVQSQLEITKRHLLLRSYFDIACHSIPLFLVQGNHDGELGWLVNGTANNTAVINSNTRKMYYPNPVPDAFYSGNSVSENFVGLRENYYAWEWGNALFIVLDPYWYTKSKPGWGWTLGANQYNWFKNTITSSHAKFKYIFCHQLVGGNGSDGRGGTEYADYFENGGNNLDSTWGFSTYRSGWEKPIHTLMVENNATIYFHGHDHFYGKQDKDGIVYQEVPQPSLKSYVTNSASSYGYVNGVILPNRGYLLVTVTDTSSTVEYIRTYLSTEENGTRHNKDVAHSYTIIKSGSVAGASDYLPVPGAFSLFQNYPNPFNPTTIIGYRLRESGFVSLKIYDILGNEVSVLVNEMKAPGKYQVEFNASTLPSGIYFYTIIQGNNRATTKMQLIK